MNYSKSITNSFLISLLLVFSSFQYLSAQPGCPTILSAGGMVEVCKGNSVDLLAEINASPSGVKFTWVGSVSGMIHMAVGPAGTFVSYIPTVTEVVTVTTTKTGCPTLSDKVKVIVHDGATFTKCTIIDNFDEPDGTIPQTVMVKSPNLGGPSFQTKTFTGLNAGGLIGNKRTMNIWYVLGDLTSRADVLKETDMSSPYFGEWFYSSSNDEGNESNTELVYGGTGIDALNLDDICGCLDVNGNPSPDAGFRLYNYFADQSGVKMTITLTDGAGKKATIIRNMPGSTIGDYDEEFSLTDFTLDVGFNWCDIDKISIFMDTNNISVDFKFDQIDFCCAIKAKLTDNSIKKCLGSCIKLDTLFNCPIPSGLIGAHNVHWKDPNGNSIAYNALICPPTAGMFNYTVNIKDSLGCESNFTQTFKICDTPSISLTNVAICNGKSVVLSPTITGGNAPISYLWSPATGLSCTTCANPTANPTTTTTYTLIVSTTENGDNGINACSGSKKVTVTVNNLPDGSITGATGLCNGASTTQICAKEVPAGNISYSWSTMATTRCIDVGAGTYTLTVTNTTTGCTATSQVTISPVPSPSVTVSSDKNNVCEGTKVILTAVGSGGTTPYTFTWSTGQSGNPIQVTPSAPSSTYIVTITDKNGCTGTNTITINATPNDIQVNVTTNPDICSKKIGDATANATGGAPPYTYVWSNGGNTQTITGLSPGAYSVTVTDLSGCSRTASGTVGNVSGPSVTITGAIPICAGQTVTLTANGTGGTAPLGYSWSPDGQNVQQIVVNPVITTIYVVTVTDANGCSATNSTTVIVNPKPQVNITPLNPVICNGAKTSLTAIVFGGTPSYSYLWSPSTGLSCTNCQNPEASPTSDQTYQVIVTDFKGCMDTIDIFVKVNQNPTPSLVSKKNEICDKKNGTITVTASGGLQPYTYLWNTSPQQSGQTASGLTAGTYMVTVTDANGCTGKLTESIINEGGPNVTITGTNPNCIGDDVTLTANPSPKTPTSYTYKWSDGLGTNQTANVNNVLITKDYFVTITDIETGCTSIGSFTLEVVGCAIITHKKDFVSVVQTGLNTYDVKFLITVDNIGIGDGKYDLKDSLAFDKDVVVNNIVYSTNASGNLGNPGPIVPSSDGNNRYILATNQNITNTDIHTFNLTISVNLNLNGPIPLGGDGQYKPCKQNDPGDYVPENGLYNLSILDTPNDFNDERDEACGELPIINHTKSGPTIVKEGPINYEITYSIKVTNSGFASGIYTLNNIPGLDDDFEVISTQYTSNAPSNPGNPGPLGLSLTSPWNLSNDQTILQQTTHTYNIKLKVKIDFVNGASVGDEKYKPCGSTVPGIPQSGEGLFNQSTLDVNDDGMPDQRDTVCDDIKIIDLALKKVVDLAGPYAYGQSIPFRITVYNQGGIPAFDVQVVDYIPSGFTFDPVNNPTWLFDGIDKANITLPGVLGVGMSKDVIIYLILKPNQAKSNAYLNYAEITGAKDSNGDDAIDIDSSPDNVNGNDTGGVPNSSTDNKIDGAPPVDEDDHDPALINVWDLALKKVFTSGVIKYGNNLTFTIWVYNQGTETAKDIKISDYIPAGYSFQAGLNPLWTNTYPNVTRTIAGPIVPGDSASVTIVLTFENNVGGYKKWINYAEITGSKDLNNVDRSADDIDSNVGSDGPAERAVLPGKINDNNITSTNKGGEEDDHDPAGSGIDFGGIFDLALRKTVITAGPYSYGQDVDFNIRIFNQGSITAQNISVVDYVPSGFQFIAGGVNTGWSYSSGSGIASRTITGPLMPGDSLNVTIRLRVLPNPGSANAYINFSEIKSAQDTLGVIVSDIDSQPDDDPLNDIGGEPGGPTDDEINDDGTVDEDDHDPAMINLYDLALRKVINTNGPYTLGQIIDFKISVYNQGTLPVQNIVVNDYIPNGYTYNAADNAGIWTGAHPLVMHTHAPLLNPGDSFVVSLKLRLASSLGGYTNWYNYSEIRSMQSSTGSDVSTLDVDSDPNQDTPGERAVTPGSANDNNITDITKVGDQDDHDPAGLSVFDLALRKTVITAGPYSYGQDIDFKIKVYNQGSVAAQNVNLIDYVPSGFQFIAGGVNTGWTYSAGNRQATRTLAGKLKPSDSAEVTIRLRLLANGATADAYTNLAEIKSAQDTTGAPGQDIDSNPDDDPNNDTGGEPGGPTDDEINQVPPIDEDDHDPAIINIFDLAIRKTLINPAAGPYTYGQVHTFRVVVFNQGNMAATNISVKDYIPAGYSFSNNNGWTGGPIVATNLINNTLQPGDSAELFINLTFNMVAVPSIKSWANYSEIASANDVNGNPGKDVDSNPGSNGINENNIIPGKPGDDDIASTSDTGFGSQDDHDPAGPWIFDLATIIENNVNQVSSYGEQVTFPIKVKNQGNIASAGYTLSVLVPSGFAFTQGPNANWSYNNVTKVATFIVPVTDTIKPGEMDMYNLILVAQPSNGADAWTVEVEISADHPVADEAGINDIDSNPDAVFNNDPGGSPIPDSEGGNFPGSDDILNGAGNGNVGDTNAAGDEDDNDPEYVRVFDLALRKRLITPATGPYTYGQIHTFTVVVYNQGNVAAKDIVVNDYIPEGYSFSNNNGWTGGPNTASTTIANTILPGDSVVLTLNLTFNMVAHPTMKSWANYSEIASANDDEGNPGDDVDSDPGSNGPNEQNIIPGKPGDDDIASNSDTGFGSQDDHDPAGPWIFDLATKVENSTAEIHFYGELINFPIEVHNQGNIPTNGYTVSVNIPSGFAFNPAFNPNWVFDNGIGLFTYVSTNVLNPGETDQFNIVLTAQPSNGPNAWTVEVEISKDHPIADEVGIKDIDSKPDNNFSNDAGGSPLPDSEDGNYPGSDDILNGAGNGVVGGTNAAGDEDDNDPEFVQVFDLALRKTLVSPAAAPYTYGQNHTFKVVVFNQGNISATNVLVSDFIPDGYTFTNNNGWTGGPNTITNLITSVIKPGDSVVLTLVLKFQMATQLTTNKTWINYAEITSAQDTLNVTRTDVDSEAGSNGPNENNVLPGKLGDDDISSNSDTGVGSQDDHDPAGPWIFDLATVIENSVDRISSYGELITFPIKVKNQGNIASAGYTLSVLVPDGFAFTQGPNTNWVYNNVTRIASYTVPVTDTIKPGEMDMYNIILTSQPASGKHAWTVELEISSDNPVADEPGINDIDSNPDAVYNNDPGGAPIPDSEGGNFPGSDDILNGDGTGTIGDTNAAGDEDDNDPEYVKIYDLALKKLLDTPAPYVYDQNLTYRVRIFNQGNEPVRNVKIQDYIPVGFSLVPALSPLWIANANGAEYLYTGTLNPTDSIDFVITLKLKNTKGGYRDWINYAEITDMQDTLGNNVNTFDVDSRPASNGPGELAVTPGDVADNNITSINKGGEEDDHDPAGIQVFDVALRKNYTGTLPIKYNQVVPFEVTVFNQGNRSAQNFVIADYLAPGYEFDAPSNPNWTYNNITRIAKTTIAAKVIPGDSAKVTLYLAVKPTLYNKTAWKNFAEIVTVTDTTNTPGDDIDSDPDDDPNNDGPPKDGEVDEKPPVDEDDHDPAEPPVVDFALRKWIPGKKPYYIPGDTVDFVISLHNQGNVVSSAVGVNDYIPQGFQFLPAINAGWAFNGPRLEYTYGTRLYPEDSVQLHLKLKVIVAANPSIPDWENYAEIRSVIDTFNVNRDNDDADSKPNTDNAWERAVHDEDPWDDVIDGNNQIENEDSDDHDPEKVVVTAWIGDYVWKDLDGDGVQDNNEPGVPGVHVYLYKCSNGSLVKKDTTDASGKYEFDFLLSDDYFLRFDALPINMPNCAFTFRDKGGNDAKDSDVDAAGVTACTFLQWGERDSTWDAGLVELASYGDYVWHDRNANGIQEPGEEGVGGVQVTLYDAVTNLPVKTTTTDNNGLYLFEKLMPMQYYAKYDPPAGWNITTANVGNDTKDSDVDNSNGPRTNATTYLSPGENDRTWDLGIWQCVMIGGRVFFDVDKDGVFDASENGLNGLRINLIDYNSGSVVATLLTAVNPATPSDDGYYKFACVKPGSYYVQFERPGHLAASEPLRGGNADKDSDIGHENGVNSTRKIVVLSGDMVLNIGAGFQNKATVGDYVWFDRNLNGLQDSGEQPIPGVKVNAYNNTTGAMVSEATTGSDGHYMLDGIAQGDYYVKFIPPVNYGFTAAHSGTDPVDNDVDGTNGYGTTRVYRIQTGDALPTIDAGLVGAVLAIEWLNFTGHHNGSFTELNWQTGVELNNDHFEIERRHESETGFTVIGQELASEDGLAAKHNYGYDDFDANRSGVYYYRLKQVDKDGHFTYSKIISIQINRSTEFNVSIYPNPVDNMLKVDITIGEESELEVRVFDKSGKNVLTNPFGGFRKAGTFNELLDTSILPAGQYNLQILTSHGIVNKQFTVLR
ncbi:MAG: DUF11 domain-containing protein [Saprospiraceae bacterium]|nr:DUF11 domain-containing protein [Candidatus Defluviibacterium haderslevense]